MVIHDIPLAQIFAMNACNAWANGLEPAGANYEDLDYLAEVQRITAAKPLTT